jgi:hypothetical protein
MIVVGEFEWHSNGFLTATVCLFKMAEAFRNGKAHRDCQTEIDWLYWKQSKLQYLLLIVIGKLASILS